MHKKYYKNPKLIIITLFLLIVLLILFTVLRNPEDTLKMIYRFTGLCAYVFIFFVIVSSEYISKMKLLLGSSFIKVHHFLARAGIMLMLVHPIAFAIEKKDLMVFLPVLYPPIRFLELAGRPALYLFTVAAIVAVYRKKFIANWKKVHYLNYLAFIMVTVHAMLIGTDINSAVSKVTVTFMSLIVAGIFFHKRLTSKRKVVKYK